MTGYDYGNARLRAKKSAFLGADDYRALLGAADVDGLLGMLSGSRYRVDVEVALARFQSIQRLDGSIALNIGRTLREMAGYYRDEPARAVGLLLERWDIRNLRAVLRGVTTRVPAATTLATLVPAGTLTAATLRMLAGATDGRSLVDLLVTLGVPDRQSALTVAGAWPAYEASGDPAQLEFALHGAYAARWRRELQELQLPTLGTLFSREADRANVLAAMRIHDLRAAGAEPPVAVEWLPGTIKEDTLADAAAAAGREELVDMLGPAAPAKWADILGQWVEHGLTGTAASEIDAALTVELVALFSGGDPLSIDIPVAFTAALENEARNLRLIGRAVARQVPIAETLERLVGPW